MKVPFKYLKSRVCNLGTAGFLMALFGLVMAFYGFPKIISTEIAKRVILTNGTENYEIWKEFPFPMSLKVYFFNVTNPDEIVSGSRPRLKEIGPFIYDQYRRKEDVVVEDENTIRFNLRRIFKFNEEKSSPLKDTDQVTILNAALLGIAISINSLFPSMMSRFEGVIPHFFANATSPFMTTSAAEVLFDGVFIDCSGSDMTVALLCQGLKSKLPPTMRPSDGGDDGFYYSMFHHLNDTLEGPYVIQSGATDVRTIGNIVSFKDSKTINEWDGECSEIKGTDSTIFAPINDANVSKTIYIFQADFCRTFFIEYIGKRMTFGLQTYRYEATKKMLGAKLTTPHNECYCKKNWSSVHNGCELDGLTYLEACLKAPVLVSNPHFYLGDPILQAYIAEGLNPNKAEHTTFVEIEAKTGAAVRGAKRIQFNMELQKISSLSMLSSVEPGVFPFLWLEEGAEVNLKVRQMLSSIHDKIKYTKVLQWIIVAIGIILMMGACHVKRKGHGEKWSWSPNRVDHDLPTYGASVPENELVRPGGAQKEGRFSCFQNKAFSSSETVAHK